MTAYTAHAWTPLIRLVIIPHESELLPPSQPLKLVKKIKYMLKI
jgi:hypothetical protein